jgi:hypothetical protein
MMGGHQTNDAYGLSNTFTVEKKNAAKHYEKIIAIFPALSLIPFFSYISASFSTFSILS